MIEVYLDGNRWAWRFIGFCGRTLWQGRDTHETDRLAFAEAKSYRTAFWAMAGRVDYRMGACI